MRFQATMRLAEQLQKESVPDWKLSIVTAGLFAAYVEMIEPSENSSLKSVSIRENSCPSVASL